MADFFDRRDFLKAGAVTVAAASLSSKIFAAGDETIGVGIIGFGGRGSCAAVDCMEADASVKIVAVGDLFVDYLEKGVELFKGQCEKRKIDQSKFLVTPEDKFVGFDAYQKVINHPDVDIVILTTPPHFRPTHLKAAIEAGKHVFIEKPVAVDPAGVRSILETSKLAEEKGLSIVAGTQRRHQNYYIDIMNRIHDGQIGEIVGGQCYWMQGPWTRMLKRIEEGRKPEWSDMEYQCRNWTYFVWLSGDHYIEQHFHNVDVMNWAIGSHPVKAVGMGGRSVRKHGNIWDHFAVEFEYPNGVRVSSKAQQIPGGPTRISERVVGTKGVSYTDLSNGYIIGQNQYKSDCPQINPYVQEHADLIAGIKNGKVLNEGKTVAESAMSLVLGRMAAYTGREIKWDWVMQQSKLDLTPPKYEWCGHAVPSAAVPGVTKLI